ncbi:hypothetical protein AFV8_gp16 [Betalipothrixvirus puteoliense]|uniref:Uncharacterized protein n=1 Tax=Betalipothrixvirus puteoliense TaxID=346884 RepID=A7WKU6_9VIRU|nr:hypothetical protein AFV8_gp16 [Acidianus filamentous virus 8]CAJ31693.1 conserved hypothetical protein [Acidianus filamentous virus 8]
MWTDISLDENNFEQDIFFYIYEQDWLKKQVVVIIPKPNPKKYEQPIIVKIHYYLWINKREGYRKTIEFQYEMSEYSIELWNKNLELIKNIENAEVLESIFKLCGCNEKCARDYNIRLMFLKSLLKYVNENAHKKEKAIYESWCQDGRYGMECYKVRNLKKFW